MRARNPFDGIGSADANSPRLWETTASVEPQRLVEAKKQTCRSGMVLMEGVWYLDETVALGRMLDKIERCRKGVSRSVPKSVLQSDLARKMVHTRPLPGMPGPQAVSVVTGRSSCGVVSDSMHLYMAGARKLHPFCFGQEEKVKGMDSKLRRVKLGSGVCAVKMGRLHSAAILSDDCVWTWGFNLHLPSMQTRRRVIVSASALAADRPLSEAHEAMLAQLGPEERAQLAKSVTLRDHKRGDQSLSHISGQLGHGEEKVCLPRPLTGIKGKPIDVGVGDAHTIIVTDQCIYSMGDNQMSQLGRPDYIGADDAYSPKPVSLLSRIRIKAVDCGHSHTVVVSAKGLVYAWGACGMGQLGLGDVGRRSHIHLPTHVPGSRDVVAVACGAFHSAALTGGGVLLTWGSNTHGELGIRSKVKTSNRPVVVRSLLSMVVLQVSCATHRTAVRTDAGEVWKCGRLAADNGFTSKSYFRRAVQVADKFVTSIALGDSHCVYLVDERLSQCLTVLGEGATYDVSVSSSDHRAALLSCAKAHVLHALQARVMLLLHRASKRVIPFFRLSQAVIHTTVRKDMGNVQCITVTNNSDYTIKVTPTLSSSEAHNASAHIDVSMEPSKLILERGVTGSIQVSVSCLGELLQRVFVVLSLVAAGRSGVLVRKVMPVRASVVCHVVPRQWSAPLLADVTPMQEMALTRAMASYVPKYIRNMYAKSHKPPTIPTSSHFPAAILFIDVSGFTALNERMAALGAEGPEQVSRHLNTYFGLLVDAVHEHGGDVVKFAGDALICMFTADEGHEEAQDAQRNSLHQAWTAVRCGMAIQHSLGLYRPNVRGAPSATHGVQEAQVAGFSMELHVGVGCGPLHALHVGGVKDRWEFLIVGDPLLQLKSAVDNASSGEVVVSPCVWDLIGSRCGGRELKGGDWLITSVEADRAAVGTLDSPHTGLSPLRGDDRTASPAPPSPSPAAPGDEGDEGAVGGGGGEGGGDGGDTALSTPVGSGGELSAVDADGPSSPPLSPAMQPALCCYVQAGVEERLRSGQMSWLAELRQVTVLFVKLTSLTFQRDEELPLGTINSALRSMQRTVFDAGGMIRQFLMDDKGTVLIAVFGVPPHSHEDDPVRSVRAALDISRSLSRDLDLDNAIGITTGNVFCGSVGSNVRQEYAVVGDVVNLSARLMGVAAKDGVSVLCDERTKNLCGSSVLFDCSLPSVRVKGKSVDISVYRPIQIRKSTSDRASDFGLAQTDMLENLVGRTAERTYLRRMLSLQTQAQKSRQRASTLPVPLSVSAPVVQRFSPRAAIGMSMACAAGVKSHVSAASSEVLSMCLIEGETGIGKTALVKWAMDVCRKTNVTYYVGRGDALEMNTPFFAWKAIVQQLLDLRLWKKGSRLMRQLDIKLESSLEFGRQAVEDSVDDAWREHIPLLCDVLPSLKFDDNDFTAQVRGDRRLGLTCNLIQHLLERKAHTSGTIVLIVENIQWVDRESLRLLHRVADTNGVVILMTQRSGPLERYVETALRGVSHQCKRMALRPLSNKNIAVLISRSLGVPADALPRQLDEVIRQVHGNPLFAQQIAMSLRESGIVTVTGDGSVRVAAKGDSSAPAAPLARRSAPLAAHASPLRPSVGGPSTPNASTSSLVSPRSGAGSPLAFALPDTVHGVIGSRVDQLSASLQLVLKVASAIGLEFSIDLLASVYPIHAEAHLIPKMVRDLCRMSFLERLSDRACSFRSAITHEVVYGRLLFSQRSSLHMEIAKKLEQSQREASMSPKDVLETAPLIAFHWERALGPLGSQETDPDTVIHVINTYRETGDYYLKTSVSEARQMYIRAKELTAHLSDEHKAVRLRLRRELALRINGCPMAPTPPSHSGASPANSPHASPVKRRSPAVEVAASVAGAIHSRRGSVTPPNRTSDFVDDIQRKHDIRMALSRWSDQSAVYGSHSPRRKSGTDALVQSPGQGRDEEAAVARRVCALAGGKHVTKRASEPQYTITRGQARRVAAMLAPRSTSVLGLGAHEGRTRASTALPEVGRDSSSSTPTTPPPQPSASRRKFAALRLPRLSPPTRTVDVTPIRASAPTVTTPRRASPFNVFHRWRSRREHNVSTGMAALMDSSEEEEEEGDEVVSAGVKGEEEDSDVEGSDDDQVDEEDSDEDSDVDESSDDEDDDDSDEDEDEDDDESYDEPEESSSTE